MRLSEPRDLSAMARARRTSGSASAKAPLRYKERTKIVKPCNYLFILHAWKFCIDLNGPGEGNLCSLVISFSALDISEVVEN